LGTRGAYGFYKDGKSKITYNHYDSYPEGLGDDIIGFIRNTNINELNSIFNQIEMVDGDTTPTKLQMENCIKYYDDSVSTGKASEWYSLLRHSQGNLEVYKQGLKYMIDSANFLKNSLHCEWAYIINLDENVLEVYEGFQKSPDENSRYKVREPNRMGYFHCKLINKFDLNNINESWIEELNITEEDAD